ncbi:dienelactone hydrolase [Rhizobium deserti]|uniref:Dienelactone hydrolase n=1 Tax=Rhizobium deserti TaxID=2547961 RepID=A0A4R5UHU7_9HYPH|nr:dienelactone hydrolase [Rhizobium deserti]TDK35442.1 dienelactone hydrolase [Rhizobium deserti]
MNAVTLLLAVSLCASATTLFAADPVGVAKISVVTQDYPRPLAATIWYPADATGASVAAAQDRIFEIPSASQEAEIRKGRFPLILLSHGSGSRAEGMGWIAFKLAQAGFIVAGTNHPGTTSGDSTPAATPKIWERTQDISALISALEVDPKWRAAIDLDRIGALGFSLGGTTVLELAGARGDLGAYIRYCEENLAMMDCRWFKGGRGYAAGEQVAVAPFDLRSVDRQRFEQSNRDSRITAVVAVDPGLATVFEPDSLRNVDIAVTLVNLGSVGEIPLAVLSDQLARQISGATYAQIDKADHFSFLPICRLGAAEFLKSVGETDPICVETERPRAEIHDELVALIAAAFERSLKAAN